MNGLKDGTVCFACVSPIFIPAMIVEQCYEVNWFHFNIFIIISPVVMA